MKRKLKRAQRIHCTHLQLVCAHLIVRIWVNGENDAHLQSEQEVEELVKQWRALSQVQHL